MSVNSEIDVSIVVAVYQGGSGLLPSLETLLRQDYSAFELIVVDDGSSDRTAEHLSNLALADRRLRVLSQAHNGLTSALIHGCNEARGRYIARHDIGDVSLPGRLMKQARMLDENPDVAIVTCGYRHLGPKGEILGESFPLHSPVEWTRILKNGDPETLHGPQHGSVMFRKSAYEAVGGYRPEFYFAQDLDLWTRLAAVGRIDYVPEILYEIGFSYGSISARYGAQQKELRRLISRATRCRAAGKSEQDLLQQAALVRKPHDESGSVTASVVSDADYFIGSCLADQKDPAARGYFKRVVRRRPSHYKAWGKLIRSYFQSTANQG